MAVLREWRAEIRRELKEEYVRYVLETGIAAYRATSGNLGAAVATRDLNSERYHYDSTVPSDAVHSPYNLRT